MIRILEIIIAFVTGTASLELIKFFYPELKRFFKTKIEAKKTFYHIIDPVLKSASELYGKLLSLSNEDFSTFISAKKSISIDPEQNKKYTYYLFAQFFGQLEIIRLQNQYTALSEHVKGYELLKFIETFEARKYRILDRSVQRIIGEHMIVPKEQEFRLMPLKDFVEKFEDKSSSFSKWISLLEKKLSGVFKNEIRQEILVFGIIISMFIDHFDHKHLTIRERPRYTNKLSYKSKSKIKNNLFLYYLTFVKDKQRYYN